MENFTPVSALAGGVLIGLSAAMLLWLNGRLAGISSVVGGLTTPVAGDTAWRVWFIAGLIGGAAIYRFAGGPLQAIEITSSLPVLIAGGFLAGFGTAMGGGCTSGHGVCGIGRFSARSVVATIIFMVVAAITVFVMRHVAGA